LLIRSNLGHKKTTAIANDGFFVFRNSRLGT